MSTPNSRKSKKGGAPAILPQALTDPSSGQGIRPLSGDQTRHIQELIDLLKKNNLTELELEREGLRIRVRNEVGVKAVTANVADQSTPGPAAASLPSATIKTQAEVTPGMITVPSPIVGTFYRSANPESEPFVNVGDRISKGQVLCIIEAMKLMNEIESDVDGVVTRIYPQNGQPVEYGEKLFAVKLSS